MKSFSLLILSVLLGCHQETGVSPDSERTMAAFIYDSRGIADGCEDHIISSTIDFNSASSSSITIQYKPTSATLPLLQKALASIPATTISTEHPVMIRFRETGKKVVLLCGWVNKPQTPEIDILEITPR